MDIVFRSITDQAYICTSVADAKRVEAAVIEAVSEEMKWAYGKGEW